MVGRVGLEPPCALARGEQPKNDDPEQSAGRDHQATEERPVVRPGFTQTIQAPTGSEDQRPVDRQRRASVEREREERDAARASEPWLELSLIHI